MSDILIDFDKKNEIPKVKIPKFATGGICNGAIFAFSQIDKIVKDIRERQDNAMAMEFTRCIGELLKKNGVVPKMTEYTGNFETDKIFETRYGVSIDELDFSEHDKVFEDKIELLNRNLNLQKDKRCEAETVRNYLAEQINQLKGENEKLKQRIAELESKETEKPTKINLNDRIKVKLTPLGAEIYYHQYDEVNKQIKGNGGTEFEPMMPQIDKDGYTEFQLHHFISLYGEHIGMCKQNVIEPLDIILVKKQPNAFTS